jgi:hypothetical protein
MKPIFDLPGAPLLLIALAITTSPRDLNCSTGAPPTAVCCAVIKHIRKDRRLDQTTREILDAYLRQCKGAEFAQKKTPWAGV